MCLRFFLCLLCLSVGLIPSVVAKDSVLALPPDWLYEGQGEAPVQAEVTGLVYEGARAQALKLTAHPLPEGSKVKQPGVVTQTLNLDLSKHRALVFKARFAGPEAAKKEFTILLSGRNLSMKRTFAPGMAESGPDATGFYSFRWDLGVPKSAEESLALVKLMLDYTGLASDAKSEVEIIDFAFARTIPAAEGDEKMGPVEPARWQAGEKLERKDVPLDGWKPGSEAVTVEPVRTLLGTKEVDAVRLTFRHGGKPSLVTVPFSVNAADYPVFSLLAKVEVPPGSKVLGDREAPMTGWYSLQFNEFLDNFGISMEAEGGFPWISLGVPSTHFLQHLDRSKPKLDGFQTFLWDMKNENPTGNKGFDLEEVRAVSFFFDARNIKPGEEVVITIIDPKFLKGLEKTGGAPTRMAGFQSYIKNYQPDYSDSSKDLGPPATGRLSEALPLIKKGVALGEIVGESSIWTPEGNGVNQLYHWLYKLTDGVKVPVTAKPTATDNVKIFVGANYAKEHFPEDLEFLKGSDGCAIRTRGKNVYIFGATPKGTLNGVYAFLEGNSDIIWPVPSETFGAVYTSHPEFPVIWGDYRHRPEARLWGWMSKTSGPGLDYQIRNRCNYVGTRSDLSFKYWGLFMEEGGGHNLHSWIPWSLWKTHPEYWAMLNGERQHPNGYKNQICLTNPDGRRIFTDHFLEAIERSPQMKKADCLNIKIEDNWGSCECEECLRPIRLPDGTLLKPDNIAFRSTQFFLFLNEVANEIHNRGYPKMQIGTYVYFFTVPTPKIPTTRALRPYFCDYVRKDYKVPIFAPINDIWWRTLNNWTAINDKVVMREYTGLFVGFRSLAEVAAFDIRAELDAGVREFTSESLPDSTADIPASKNLLGTQMDASFLEYWLITRLYWDPGADVEHLRKYAIRRTFREAAPAMEKFFGTIRQLYFKEKRATEFEEEDETLRLVLRKGREKELAGYLKEALEKAKHPISRLLVLQVKEYFEHRIEAVKMAQGSGK